MIGAGRACFTLAILLALGDKFYLFSRLRRLSGASLTIELFIFRLKTEVSNERCMAQSRGDMLGYRKVLGKLDKELTSE